MFDLVSHDHGGAGEDLQLMIDFKQMEHEGRREEERGKRGEGG